MNHKALQQYEYAALTASDVWPAVLLLPTKVKKVRVQG